MNNIDLLLYLDKGYIETTYNYYYPNVTELTEGKTQNKDASVGMKFRLLKNLPIISIDPTAEIGLSHVSISESKITPTIEAKLSEILKRTFNGKPTALIDLIQNSADNGIYFFRGVFELLSIESKKGNDLLIENKYRSHSKGLVWKLKLITYDLCDANVNMALSGDKILINYHHLTNEIEKYKQFRFDVLGKMTKHDEKNFSIKPIAIFYL